MIVKIIPCLSDNYSYLIHDEDTNTISIVDPAEFKACDEIIKKYKKKTRTKFFRILFIKIIKFYYIF